MKDELGGKIMTKFVWLRVKTYTYLIDDGSEDKKKAKGAKMCVIKRKLKFENYKNCLEATQLKNETNCLEKDKIDIEELLRNNNSIFKTQQRLKSERYNVFTVLKKLIRLL